MRQITQYNLTLFWNTGNRQPQAFRKTIFVRCERNAFAMARKDRGRILIVVAAAHNNNAISPAIIVDN